jgi:hypothetical protein
LAEAAFAMLDMNITESRYQDCGNVTFSATQAAVFFIIIICPLLFPTHVGNDDANFGVAYN